MPRQEEPDNASYYAIRFDIAYAAKARDFLNVKGYKEGKDYRIGMSEERHTMGLRSLHPSVTALLILEITNADIPVKSAGN